MVLSLNVKAKMHDIAILNYIFLPLQAQATRFFRSLLTLIFYEIIIGNRFSTDKTSFEVTMNYSSTLM